MNYKYLFLLTFLSLLSCDENYKTPPEIENIPIKVQVKRFDQDFLNAKESDFGQLKKKYPYLAPKTEGVNDPWKADKKDTLVQEVLEETVKKFPDFVAQEEELTLLFKHIKYNFPEFTTPETVTLISMVDYRNRVLLKNNTLLIALDSYLGENHKFYEGFSSYISAHLAPKYIVTDVANVYAKNYTQKGKQRLFVEQMVYFGKLLYLKDQFIPFKPESNRIGYTPKELEWAKINESMIWSYFVDKDLLFSTDTKLSNRFIANAPFSKFYLAVDNESPGRLGQYIGWQIVRSFMQKNDVSLRKLCTMSNEEIFRKSKYKPKK